MSIGGFYSSGILGVDPDGYSYEEGYNNYLDLGGISMSYCFNPENLFHYTAFLKSGFGNLALLKDEEFLNFTLYVFNPGISIDYKLTNHLKIGLLSSYRMISPVVLVFVALSPASSATPSRYILSSDCISSDTAIAPIVMTV